MQDLVAIPDKTHDHVVAIGFYAAPNPTAIAPQNASTQGVVPMLFERRSVAVPRQLTAQRAAEIGILFVLRSKNTGPFVHELEFAVESVVVVRAFLKRAMLTLDVYGVSSLIIEIDRFPQTGADTPQLLKQTTGSIISIGVSCRLIHPRKKRVVRIGLSLSGHRHLIAQGIERVAFVGPGAPRALAGEIALTGAPRQRPEAVVAHPHVPEQIIHTQSLSFRVVRVVVVH